MKTFFKTLQGNSVQKMRLHAESEERRYVFEQQKDFLETEGETLPNSLQDHLAAR